MIMQYKSTKKKSKMRLSSQRSASFLKKFTKGRFNRWRNKILNLSFTIIKMLNTINKSLKRRKVEKSLKVGAKRENQSKKVKRK